MAKITIDVDYIKTSLAQIGYQISDCIERENNGKLWQIKFSNSGAIITIYDSNTTKNTVVNGKLDAIEKSFLKNLVDGLKCKTQTIDPLNQTIVDLISSKKEDFYYDFKREWYHPEKREDLLHDILCMSNNLENRDAYLIIGVDDNYDVIGVCEEIKSHNVFDFIKQQKFAGNHIPEIELKKLHFMYKTIYVVVCKSSKNVPFYLSERCHNVCANQIYTRVGDTNTPKNTSANYAHVEHLWQIHFERKAKQD